MVFDINTTRDISKLRITILKYNSWYLCQISLQIMLLPLRIRSLRVQIANFSRLYCLAIPRRDLPESLGVMLEF